MSGSAMKTFYAIASGFGLLLPIFCFSKHFIGRGDSAWPEFFAAPFSTWVLSGFTWDLLLTATVRTIWMSIEARRLKIPGFYWHFAAIFLVGICFALPTFLLRREAYVDARSKQ